jgi:DNA topoisomerase IB
MKVTFNSLTHNGPVFPKEYEPVGYTFKGEVLPALAEEMLYAWAQKIETPYVKEPIVIENFWKCLKPELKSSQVAVFPDDYKELIDKMHSDILAKKAAKKEKTKEEKKQEQAEKEAMKAKYGFALFNGVPNPLGSYLIEGPGIILTRGKSPVKGLWKYRTQPEDVTINFVDPTGKVPVPQAPAGHHWKEVVSSKSSAYVFKYKVDVGHINLRDKAVRFGAGSEVSLTVDEKKYDNAVKLLKVLPKLEKRISDGLKSSDNETRQEALVAYLIEHTAIRIGSEKNLDLDADTVGMSTMKVGNINLHIDEE